MEMSEDWSDGVAILTLAGRFDGCSASSVSLWLHAATESTPHVVVDLAKVTFLDSMALATLVHGLKRCQARGGDLRLGGLRQPVRTIFELTRLDSVFALYQSRDEALKSIQERELS